MTMKTKISVYQWFTFSRTRTFGWYVTVLHLCWFTPRRYYNESVYRSLFSFSYSMRAAGITEDGMYWRGSSYALHLFFMRVLYIERRKTFEEIIDEREY